MKKKMGCCIVCKWRNEFEPRRMLHKFPLDPMERKLWTKAIGKNVVNRFVTICSKHFKRSCYVTKMNGQVSLKPGSVPTLHLKEQPKNNDASKIEQTKAAKKFSCDECKRKFLTGTALSSHLHHVHKKPYTARQKANTIVVKPQYIAKKSTTKMPDADVKELGSKLNKPCFECPVCQIQFPTYFSAFQHIQRFHCVNSKGQKVSPLALDIVKPIRMEECICSETIRSDKQHNCSMKTDIETDNKYFCLGCEQIFDNLSLYQVHLKGLHGDDVESFFFPKRSDFTAWKTQLENETKTNYVKLMNTSVYHCTHQPLLASSNLTHLCPATITIKQIVNGYHISYYKTHVGHEYIEYTTPEALKKHCITSFFKETEDIDIGAEDDEKDMYLQFKKIMNSIVLDAAKINITTLQILLEKAFEITTILNSYDEDDDNVDVSSKKMSDEQISRVLEDNKTLKRKGDPLPQDAKKVKSIDNGDVKIDSPRTPVRMLQSPPSFNDSYKSFVDQNFKNLETKDKKKKEIVKTKIGQFKPSSPKADAVKIVTPNADKSKLATPNADTPKIVTRKADTPKIETPKADMPKIVTRKADTTKIVTPNADTPKIVTRKADKTKIVTPKADTPKIETPETITYESRMPRISKVWTMKPDVKYEVKERDNDCNILILKI